MKHKPNKTLISLREDRGLTLRDAAKGAKVSLGTIYRAEGGDLLRVDHALRIARFYKRTVEHIWKTAVLVALLTGSLLAVEPVKTRRFDTPYWSAVGAAAGATAFDAFATVHGCRGTGVVEEWSPWLYGKRPQPARTIGIMSAEVIGNALASRWLRTHNKRWWWVPLSVVTSTHLSGAIYSRSRC